MNAFVRLSAALAVSAGLIGPSLAELGGAVNGGFDPAGILNTPAPEVVELQAFDMNRVIGQQMRLIRYQATEYQRKVAEARVRAYVSAQRRAIAQTKPVAKSTKPAKPAGKTTKTPTKTPTKTTTKTPTKPTAKEPVVAPTPEPQKAAKPTAKAPPAEPPPAEPKKLPRYIAVDTVKDKRASPKAKKVVMVWDTHAEAFVGNNIYDVENPPPLGSTTKFETYAAEYIGTGL